MAAMAVEQPAKTLHLAEPAPASKGAWVDVEAVKPVAPVASSAGADAASARRRRNLKVALGVGTGILVALFVALTIALAVTYTRDCDKSSPATANPGGSASGSQADSSQQSSSTSNPTAGGGAPCGRDKRGGQQHGGGDAGGGAAAESRVSRFRQGPDTVVVTPLTAALVKELGVDGWSASTTEAMTTLNAKWDQDRDVYIKSGKVMITWYVTIENLGGSPATSVAETAMVEAGQLVTVPAGVKTTWTFIRTTEQLTKVYA